MKKLFYVGALSALLLAACGEEETSNENAIKDVEEVTKEEVSEESNVSESEIGKMTTLYQNKELNMPIESAPL